MTPQPTLVPSPSIPTTFTDNLPLPRLFVFDLDYTLWPFWVDTHVTPPLRPANATSSTSTSTTSQGRKSKKTWLQTQFSKDTTPNSDDTSDTDNTSRESTNVNTAMVDRYGEHLSFYPGVPSILSAAKQRNIQMSVASRTHAPDLAREMLKGLYVPCIPLSSSSSTSGSGSGSGAGWKHHADVNGNAGEDEDENHDTAASVNSSTKRRPPSKSRAHQAKDKPKPTRALDFFTNPQMYPGSKTSHFRAIQKHTKIAYEDMMFFDDEARNRNVEGELGVVFVLVRDGVTAAEVDRGVKEWRRRRGVGGGERNGRGRGGGDSDED